MLPEPPRHWTDDLVGLGDDELREELERRIAANVDDLCPPKGRRDPFSVATRAGRRKQEMTINRRSVTVRLQRIMRRSDGRTVDPPIYKEIRAAEWERRDWRSMQKLLLGVTTRNLKRDAALDNDGKSVDGLGKTTVSEAFKRFSRVQVSSVIEDQLDDVNIVGAWVDGTRIGDQTVIVALGLTGDGEKILLGIGEGDREDEAAVERVIRGIVEDRRADLSHVLWMLDRGQALRDGIKAVVGECAVQNCTRHMAGNVRDEMNKMRFDGISHRLHKAAKDPTRPGATKKINRLVKELEAGVYGTPEANAAAKVAAGVIRERAAELQPLSREQRRAGQTRSERDRTDAVKAIHSALRHLVGEETLDPLWTGVLGRLHRAWGQRDPDRALADLQRLKDELVKNGDEKAAATMSNLEETVTVNALGVTGPLKSQLDNNNNIESLNNVIKEQTKRHHTSARDPNDDIRTRWAVAAILSKVDSDAWSLVGTPQELLAMQLNLVARRHAAVDLQVTPLLDGIALWNIEVDRPNRGQGLGTAALVDVLEIADRAGKSVALVADGAGRGVNDEALAKWFASHGFEASDATSKNMTRLPNVGLARSVESGVVVAPEQEAAPTDRAGRTVDPLEPLRETLGEKWAAVVNQRALAFGPTVASKSEQWLGERKAENTAEMERVGLVEREGSDLREPIARLVGLAREHERRGLAFEAGHVIGAAISPLGSRGSELHDRAAGRIEARAVEVAPWLEGRKDEALEELGRRLGNPIDILAKQVALERESISRAELRQLAQEPTNGVPGSERGTPPARSLDDLAPCLPRAQLEPIRQYAKALAAQHRDADLASLRTALARLDDPEAGLDLKDVRERAELTKREREAVTRRGKQIEEAQRLRLRGNATRGRLPGEERRGTKQRGEANQSRLSELEAELGEVELAQDKLRADGPHHDTWFNERGWDAARWFGLSEAIAVKERDLVSEQDAVQLSADHGESVEAARLEPRPASELVVVGAPPEGPAMEF